MQVTNQEIIDRRWNNAGEIMDGLITFCAQGASVIEMCIAAGDEVNEHGFEIPYDHYQITVWTLPEDHPGMEFTEISQFSNLRPEELGVYQQKQVEYWDSQASAYARYMQLVIEHNHF